MNTSKNKPLVSIVMPVRDAGNFLVEAINSIKEQTYANWELIAVDDNSSDDTQQKLKNIASKDDRIKVFKNETRVGPSAAANLAIKKAKGRYIARMDADDISLSERLEEQVLFLEKNKDAVAVGGQCLVIDDKGNSKGEKMFPTDAKEVERMIFSSVPLQQPTLMVDRDRLPGDFLWYENALDVAEEVDLLFRLFEHGKVYNLPNFVLKYRIHGQNISLKNPKRTFFLTLKTRLRAVLSYGYVPSLKGVLLTLAQTIVVFLLPSDLVYPTYAYIRGINDSKDSQFKPKAASVRGL